VKFKRLVRLEDNESGNQGKRDLGLTEGEIADECGLSPNKGRSRSPRGAHEEGSEGCKSLSGAKRRGGGRHSGMPENPGRGGSCVGVGGWRGMDGARWGVGIDRRSWRSGR